MFSLYNELVGKRCEITTTEDYHEGILVKLHQNVAVVHDEFEEKDIYLNLYQVVSIHESPAVESDLKSAFKGIFKRKNDLEEME